jgi:hypothetical protein
MNNLPDDLTSGAVFESAINKDRVIDVNRTSATSSFLFSLWMSKRRQGMYRSSSWNPVFPIEASAGDSHSIGVL